MSRAALRYSVVAAVWIRDGRVLVTQRREGDAFAGLWELPGGKVEGGESHAEALIREIEEELGIRVAVGPLFHREQAIHRTGREIDLFFYRVEHVSGVPRCLEVSAILWASPDRLETLESLPSNRSTVLRLRRELGGAVKTGDEGAGDPGRIS